MTLARSSDNKELIIAEMLFILECSRAAVEEAGAKDFDGQAFLATAVKFGPHWEGSPEEVGGGRATCSH